MLPIMIGPRGTTSARRFRRRLLQLDICTTKLILSATRNVTRDFARFRHSIEAVEPAPRAVHHAFRLSSRPESVAGSLHRCEECFDRLFFFFSHFIARVRGVPFSLIIPKRSPEVIFLSNTRDFVRGGIKSATKFCRNWFQTRITMARLIPACPATSFATAFARTVLSSLLVESFF